MMSLRGKGEKGRVWSSYLIGDTGKEQVVNKNDDERSEDRMKMGMLRVNLSRAGFAEIWGDKEEGSKNISSNYDAWKGQEREYNTYNRL